MNCPKIVEMKETQLKAIQDSGANSGRKRDFGRKSGKMHVRSSESVLVVYPC